MNLKSLGGALLLGLAVLASNPGSAAATGIKSADSVTHTGGDRSNEPQKPTIPWTPPY